MLFSRLPPVVFMHRRVAHLHCRSRPIGGAGVSLEIYGGTSVVILRTAARAQTTPSGGVEGWWLSGIAVGW